MWWQRYSVDIKCCICMSQRKKAELNPTCVPAENAETPFRVSNVKKGLEQPKPLRRGGCQALTCPAQGVQSPTPGSDGQAGTVPRLAPSLGQGVAAGTGRVGQGSVSKRGHYRCCYAQPVPHFE